MNAQKTLIFAFFGLAGVYLGYLMLFRSFMDMSLLIAIGVIILVGVILIKNTQVIKTPEAKTGKVTWKEAKESIEEYIKYMFHGKTIDYNMRDEHHAYVKSYRWGNKDHEYYGVIARLTPDLNAVRGEKVRVIWNMETNQFALGNNITKSDEDWTDPFHEFEPMRLIGEYSRRRDLPYEGAGNINVFDKDLFHVPTPPEQKEEDTS